MPAGRLYTGIFKCCSKTISEDNGLDLIDIQPVGKFLPDDELRSFSKKFAVSQCHLHLFRLSYAKFVIDIG